MRVLSYLWALVPLITLGLASWMIIGSAAIRLANRRLTIAAIIHFAMFIAVIVVVSALNGVPDDDWRNQLAMWFWILAPWIGGTVHAFLLRAAVFAPRPQAWGAPVTTPYTQGPPPRTTAPSPPPAIGIPGPRPGGLGWLGPYQLLDKIGEGGQGAVYLARHPDGRQVAVKLLRDRIGHDPTQQSNFLREATAAQRVPPFATARVLDVGVADTMAYIVSEYVHGRSLERMVREGGPLAVDSLTRLAIQTSAALSGIHSAGIVHRDFKPSNVLIAPDGARVIDFGVAKALEQVTMTSGGPKGTPAYMSPEQISGLPIGPESDVFSWGSTMLFAATGRLAFAGASYYQTAQMIMHYTPDLSMLPAALRHPIARCLDKDPRNRPTAAELMVALTR